MTKQINRAPFTLTVDHSGDEDGYECWEGISILLILSRAAQDLDLTDKLNERTQQIWYNEDEDSDEAPQETEVGVFDLAVMWLRNHMTHDGVDVFEDYEVQKLVPEKAVCEECKVFVDENNKGHESYCSKKEKE